MEWMAGKWIDRKYVLAEGPMYDYEREIVSWVDIKGCRLCKRLPNGIVTETEVGQYIGAAVPMQNGHYLGCMTTGLYEIGDSVLRKVLRPESFQDGQRCNDGKVDPKGNLWFGTMPLYHEDQNAFGDLYVFDGVTCSKKLSRTGVANGMAWSTDQKTMYFIDTTMMRVDAFDYYAETQQISNRRVIIYTAEGCPDGMTIDSEGMLWIALWGAGKVVRFDPKTGRRIATVFLPTPNVSSCCFVGKDLKTLLITTSGEGLSDEYAGRIYRADVGIAGLRERYVSF